MVEINTIEELLYWMNQGRHPLYEWRSFFVDPELRRSVQNLLFAGTETSRGDIVKSNQKFYYHCWAIHEEKQCEECFKPLQDYSATFISHILPRGGYPEFSLDIRNHNLLCKTCHSHWESLSNTDMVIYEMNKIIIKIIKNNS